MAPIACREPEHDSLTGEGITSVISYWPTSQRSCWHDAHICLGENPTETYKHFDLCYSFKILCLEGHRTLMVHECLMVVATLGRFHHWQRRVELAGRDKPDWMKVPTISAGDFRYKYSPVLDLLGNAQHPTYAHPKLLGWCFDNIYHQGQFIGDLPAQGKPPSKG